MKKILKNRNGESLVETLVSLLIVSIAILMITQSVMSAGKINSEIKEEDVSFKYDDNQLVSNDANIHIIKNDPSYEIGYDGKISIYSTSNGYYYYTVKK